MPFKLSEYAPYKTAVFAQADGQLGIARVEFRKCLEACRAAGGPPMISGMLFRLGDVEALDGNRDGAIRLYEEALAADPGSPLALISCAESLFGRLGEPAQALKKLEEAESLIAFGGWQPSEDDLSEPEYRRLIAKNQAVIAGAQ